MNFRDVELLSAYLDGQLSPSDAARLERRLKSDAELRSALDNLRATRSLLRSLPVRSAPRNFLLTPKMAGIKPPEARSYPVFRFATALAAFLLLATVALNGFASVVSPHLLRQAAPAYGIGGGPCDNCSTGTGLGGAAPATPAAPAAAPAVTPAATEAPALALPAQPFAAGLPTETPSVSQENTSKLAAETPEVAIETMPPALGLAPENALPKNQTDLAAPTTTEPVPLGWQIGLGALVLVFGVIAGSVRLNGERNFRRRWNKK